MQKKFIGLKTAVYLFASAILLASPCFGRAGGGRSVGRGSSFSSRRSAPPPHNAPARPAPAAPDHANRSTSPPANNAAPAQNQPAPPPQAPPSSGGGFMRGLAGGIAGGMIGNMLFHSLGASAGTSSIGAAGGIGFFDILLIGAILFFVFRWWTNRQQKQQLATFAADGVTDYSATIPYSAGPTVSPLSIVPASMKVTSSLTTDAASDIFFRLQGAWTRRDLSSVGEWIDRELLTELNEDLRELKEKKQINRLENIAIRSIELRDAWTEPGMEFATMRILASLLDYHVEEGTEQIVDGSNYIPVKFEEDWVFCRLTGDVHWKLCSIAPL